MIVLIEATYPGTKVEETTTTWLEYHKDNPLPEYLKLIDLYAFIGGDGIRVLQLMDVETGKEDEGYKYIGSGVVFMVKAIEGYRADIHTVYNMAEALEFLDMKVPDVF
jgi:hypothetical protein